MDVDKTFERLREYQLETAKLQAAQALLEWDEQTGMPPAAEEFRSLQIEQLAGMIHDRETAAELGDLLESLADLGTAAEPTDQRATTIQVMQREYDRAARLDTRLVRAISAATTRGQQSWRAARRNNSFAAFAPALTTILNLKREAAAALAQPGQTRYEALLDDYEPDLREHDLETTFSKLRPRLIKLLQRSSESTNKPDDQLLRRSVPLDRQEKLSRFAAERIGFDFSAGRLDITTHPFCTSLGPGDIRILTRYQENWLPAGLFGTLHEAGHGMYEQGLHREWFGLPPGRFASLAIHESQSRLWENVVGRSQAFWDFFWPQTRQMLAPSLDDVPEEDFWRAINRFTPSLIRVEADEVSYNLHIVIRFELERKLLADELTVDDLPQAWADRYESDLGIRPETEADGVLQDVHWAAGLIGYFPTYTLGNIIASQLMQAATAELGDQSAAWRKGDFSDLHEWLQRNIYSWGRTLPPLEVVRRATGTGFDSAPLLTYLEAKFDDVYGR